MFVEVAADGVLRRWTLIAEAGDGPWIPTVPAAIIAAKLAGGTRFQSGARAALDCMTLAEFEAAVSHLNIKTALEESRIEPAS